MSNDRIGNAALTRLLSISEEVAPRLTDSIETLAAVRDGMSALLVGRERSDWLATCTMRLEEATAQLRYVEGIPGVVQHNAERALVVGRGRADEESARELMEGLPDSWARRLELARTAGILPRQGDVEGSITAQIESISFVLESASPAEGDQRESLRPAPDDQPPQQQSEVR